MDIVTLALAKAYSNKVGSTIQGTSYDYDTGKLTFNTTDFISSSPLSILS